ncbi:MAG: hypothetical protein ABDH59_00920, partial [Fervidobacterium sp.]
LMDETRTDIEGSVGILLKNGIWLYGEPNQITASGGAITNPYAIVTTNLGNIVYFSYAKPSTFESFLKKTEDHIPNIVPSEDDQTVVELANGSKFIAKSMDLNIDASGPKFSFTDDFGTYTFAPNYIWSIFVERSKCEDYKYMVETKKGTYIICNLKFSGENIVMNIPFGKNYILKLNQISSIGKYGVFSFTTDKQSLVKGEQPGYAAAFWYDAQNKVLRVGFMVDSLTLEGKSTNEIVIELPSK